VLAAETRNDAVDSLLSVLGADRESARIDPSRTLIEVNSQLWTLVALAAPKTADSPSMRRAGAKHKRVR
jgi:hypothetical protein